MRCSIRSTSIVVVFTLALLGSALPAPSFTAGSEGGPLPAYDARYAQGEVVLAGAIRSGDRSPEALLAGPPAGRDPARLDALAGLRAEVGGPVESRWDPVTGSPALLFARKGFLSEADPRPAEPVARDFLLGHRRLFRLSELEVMGLRVSDRVPLAGGGSVVWFRQEIAGLPVDQGLLAVALDGAGRVVTVSGAGVRGGELPAGAAARLTPGEALLGLGSLAGLEMPAEPPIGESIAGGAVFSLSAVSGRRVRVEKVVAHTVWGPRIAWRARIRAKGETSLYEVVLDDESGRPLRRQELTWRTATSGRVFRVDPDAGDHVLMTFPDRTVYRVAASPLGWTAEDRTEGNNAIVRDDRAGDDDQTLGTQAVAMPAPPGISFDYPWTGVPDDDLDAALTQVFYTLNLAHDRFYDLGFDEASGNFQSDNRGLGGTGGDPVLGDVQDGEAADNAWCEPAPEGMSPRITLGIFSIDGTKDSAFESEVAIHEYTHAVSTRLVGGPSNVSALSTQGQQGALGEGWSDFFPSSFLEDPVVGNWITGNPTGIRTFRVDDNPLEGKDYRNYCRFPGDMASMGYCESHKNGEIWSGFLWRLRETFEEAYGPAGVTVLEGLVLDAMKLTPPAPTFLDGRDAILLADRLATGGAHACMIRGIAAERWMGYSASTTGTMDTSPVPANDQWPECVDEGIVFFTRSGLEGDEDPAYSCADEVTVSVIDGNAIAPLTVRVESSGGDAETVTLSATVDPAVFTAMIHSDGSSAPAIEDGILQVAHGDSLMLTYFDVSPASRQHAYAQVSCAADIAIAGHRVANSNCDEDSVPGFPSLPGFVDEGESAELELTLENRMPVEVVGAVQVSTDRPDLLTILPSGSPVPVTLPAASASSPGRATVTVQVAAAADFAGATEAEVVVALLADGYGETPAQRLTLLLNRDYELSSGLTMEFDVEGETGGPVGPGWSTGLLGPGANQWTLVECNAATGTRAYRNGPADCTGEYSDEQGNPWLATPPMDLLPPGAVGARVVRVSYHHDVDLGVGGMPGLMMFDADGVAVYLTNDPSTVDTGSAAGTPEGAIAMYVNMPDFGMSCNTSGFELETVDVQDGSLAGVDFTRPVFLVWAFLPDITQGSSPFGEFDVQGEGYYVDDVSVTYDVVYAVPHASTCESGPVPLSNPAVGGTACTGEAVLVDASLSEAANCGPPSDLEYRFRKGGALVACYEDVSGPVPVPRDMDAQGWGVGPRCWDYPAGDTTYEVEVRCQVEPQATDTASVTARVLEGSVLVRTDPPAICGSVSGTVAIDAGGSWMSGCEGDIEYFFLDAAGAPLDCDGDTAPDGPSEDPTCAVDPAGGRIALQVGLRCADLPDCPVVEDFTMEGLVVTPDLAQVEPLLGYACPGEPFEVTAAASSAVGCSGYLQYRFTTSAGHDSGWTTNPVYTIVFTEDGIVQAEVRCNVAPDCGATATLAVTTGQGAPTGEPLGTLRVSRRGSCPDGADLILDWSDSGRFPATFAVLRSDRPGFDLDKDNIAEPTGVLEHTDEDVACDGGSGWPWRGGNLYFYSVIDRNPCTGELINDR
jgi:hypothetical protein